MVTYIYNNKWRNVNAAVGIRQTFFRQPLLMRITSPNFIPAKHSRYTVYYVAIYYIVCFLVCLGKSQRNLKRGRHTKPFA